MVNLCTNAALMQCLACAALNQALRSIVVFDAPYEGLQELAEIWRQLLVSAGEGPVASYSLSTYENDDDLWGSIMLPGGQDGGLQLHQRIFSPQRSAKELQMITIPDLTRISLANTRSALMLIDSPVAHLERNHQQGRWQPRQCWLASCPYAARGHLSPHLLDRFALRLSWSEIIEGISPSPASEEKTTRASALQTLLKSDEINKQTTIPEQERQRIQEAVKRRVAMTAEGLERVLDYTQPRPYYARREIALARFALALAQYQGEQEMNGEHVDAAAALLGLRPQTKPEEPHDIPEEPAPAPIPSQKHPLPERNNGAGPAPEETGKETIEEQPVREAQENYNERISLPAGPLCKEPYPEDEAPLERDAASLKLPYTHHTSSRTARGQILSIEASDTLQDLAPISTILAALRFQRIRGRKKPDPLRFEPMDLRRYRRGTAIEQLLLFLLDYTSVREQATEEWQSALEPYLREAYVARAGISIIQVGNAEAQNELRAEIVSAGSILVPRIGLALDAERGRASPLAHGLMLAHERLQHILQHGRETAQHATLVVISDGRGNIPLRASQSGKLDGITTRQGITDALEVAERIRALRRVKTIVLNPQPRDYQELPAMLAKALGARLEKIGAMEETQEGEEVVR